MRDARLAEIESRFDSEGMLVEGSEMDLSLGWCMGRWPGIARIATRVTR